MNACYHRRKADVRLSARCLPQQHLLAAREPCVGSRGFPAPRPHETLGFCIIRTSRLPSFMSLSGFTVGHWQRQTISEGRRQSRGCSAEMAHAMSREPGFPGKSLPAWSVHSHGVGGRGQPQPEEPPARYAVSNDGLMDPLLLPTYRLLFPLEERPVPSPGTRTG